MKQTMFKKNIPIDEKRISFIENVVTRLTRRAKKHAITLTPPCPISGAFFGNGIKDFTFHYMFPCDGKITKGAIDFGKKPRKEILINFKLMGSETGITKSFATVKKRLIMSPDVEVKEGDKLTISIDYDYDEEKPENNINELWVSFLFIPAIKDAEAKRFLIDNLENDLLEE